MSDEPEIKDESADVPKKKNPLTGKKVSEEVLLKRKLGRMKAAENMAKKIKNSGIEKVDNNLLYLTFQSIPLVNQKNYYTDYLKKDDQITFLRQRKELFTVKKGRKSNLEKQKELKEKLLKEENKFDLNLDDEEIDDDDNDDDIDDGTPASNSKKSLKTIVIHPGLRNIRVGFSQDVYPKTIPNVIAVPRYRDTYETLAVNPKREIVEDQVFFDEGFEELKAVVQKDFKERMRYYKRRILPNSNESVKNFNKKVQPEVLLEINDPYKIDWISNEALAGRKFLVGEDALKLEDHKQFRLRYPIRGGKFNEDPEDYQSQEEVVGDIQIMVREILKDKFDLSDKDFFNYNTVLIIPDLYDKVYVESWIGLLLKMKFHSAAVIQETVCATFGAGVSQACVVDIGAQSTTISCIDEGMILNDSRIRLDFGGDDITVAFTKLLLQSEFPYGDINLNRVADWNLASDLKEKYTTFEDANIAIQLYDFIKRLPREKAEKYQFKLFDEVMVSPLGLFYPELFELENSKREKSLANTNKLFPNSIDAYTGKSNNPTSLSQKNLLNGKYYGQMSDEEILESIILGSRYEDQNVNNLNLKKNELDLTEASKLALGKLDYAIIESITNACKNDLTNYKKYYENLLIVGGVAKTPGLDLVLTDRVNIWRPRVLGVNNIYEILQKINDSFNSKKTAKDTDDAPNEQDIKILEQIISKIYPKLLEQSAVSNSIEVLSPPRDIDPQILTWKGASVFARLKIAQELRITQSDWDFLGSRSLHYKALFSY